MKKAIGLSQAALWNKESCQYTSNAVKIVVFWEYLIYLPCGLLKLIEPILQTIMSIVMESRAIGCCIVDIIYPD